MKVCGGVKAYSHKFFNSVVYCQTGAAALPLGKRVAGKSKAIPVPGRGVLQGKEI
jgi:hypothetical protein